MPNIIGASMALDASNGMPNNTITITVKSKGKIFGMIANKLVLIFPIKRNNTKKENTKAAVKDRNCV